MKTELLEDEKEKFRSLEDEIKYKDREIHELKEEKREMGQEYQKVKNQNKILIDRLQKISEVFTICLVCSKIL